MFFAIFKLVPKFLHSISLIIAIFLLSFLLLGCTGESSTYSKVYLAKFQFNNTSPTIANNLTSNSSSIMPVALSVGYLGLCASQGKVVSCTSYSTLDSLRNSTSINLGNSSGKIPELTSIAVALNNACHPRLLMATIVIILATFTMCAWCCVPMVPCKRPVRMASCGLSGFNVLLWGFGSMLQHTAVSAAAGIVPAASMSLVSMQTGGRADAMTWTAFLFLTIALICSVFGLIREEKEHKTHLNTTPPNPDPQLYNSKEWA